MIRMLKRHLTLMLVLLLVLMMIVMMMQAARTMMRRYMRGRSLMTLTTMMVMRMALKMMIH